MLSGFYSPSSYSQNIKIKDQSFELVFSDEFDGKSIDTSKWNFRTDSKHWSTQLPQNNRVSDGVLYLDLKKEKAGNKEYTGAGLISKDTFGFGYYEAKMMTPKGAGWHTSFWLMGHDGSGGTSPSATCLEIDIVENDSKVNLGYLSNLHLWKGTHKDFGGKYVPSEGLNQDFQKVGCLFREDSLFFFYNDKEVDKRRVADLPKCGMNIWLTSIASFLGDTKAVDEALLPAAAQFQYVRFYKPKSN